MTVRQASHLRHSSPFLAQDLANLASTHRRILSGHLGTTFLSKDHEGVHGTLRSAVCVGLLVNQGRVLIWCPGKWESVSKVQRRKGMVKFGVEEQFSVVLRASEQR